MNNVKPKKLNKHSVEIDVELKSNDVFSHYQNWNNYISVYLAKLEKYEETLICGLSGLI